MVLSFLCTSGIVTNVNCIWQSLVQKQICQINKCSVEEYCFIQYEIRVTSGIDSSERFIGRVISGL